MGVEEKERLIRMLLKDGGRTLAELVRETGFPKTFINHYLSKLEGANKVIIRQIGKAKLYTLNI